MNILKQLAWLCVIACWSASMMGCATGRDFDMSLKDQIVKGKTTKDEVIELLGEPYISTASNGGIVNLTYYHHMRTVLNDSTREQRGSTAVVTPHFEMTGVAKRLDVSLKDGVVIDVHGDTLYCWSCPAPR